MRCRSLAFSVCGDVVAGASVCKAVGLPKVVGAWGGMIQKD